MRKVLTFRRLTLAGSAILLLASREAPAAPARSVMLAEALRERRVAFEELVFPDEVHDFLTHAHWLAAYRAAAAFLDRKLGTEAAR